MDKGSAKKTIIPKLVCVLLSFCLWIYVTNVETTVKTYTLKNVPVKLINVESLKNSGLALAPNQTFDVNLNLEGPSKYIYSVKKSDFIIRADLSEYALKKGENNIPVQIINYPQQINIKNNGYLIVKVNLEALETKTFNSVSDVDVDFAPNVYKDSVEFASEKIEVSGPQSAVNSVAKVALVGSLSNVSDPITKTFKYEPLNANNQVVTGVQLSKTTGSISITTNKGKKVGIVAQFTGSLPKGVSLVGTQLSQNFANIVGSKDVLSNINTIKTKPIDLTNIKNDTNKTVELILPNGVTLSNGNKTITVTIDVSGPAEENKDNNNNGSTSNSEKELTIPVNYTGLAEGLKLSNNPSNVTIKITGAANVLNGISIGDFKATVDLSSYKEPGDISVVPKIQTTKNIIIESIPDLKISIIKDSSKDEKVSNK